jgi:hypothetical protein
MGWTGELRLAAADPTDDARAMRALKAAVPMGRNAGFVPAPAFDDEHPDELSYRPFPIAPLLTASSSADDPALTRLVHPNLARTLEMLDQGISALPMRLRPGLQSAQIMWAQEFKGEAINFLSLADPEGPTAASQLANRVVHTQAQ